MVISRINACIPEDETQEMTNLPRSRFATMPCEETLSASHFARFAERLPSTARLNLALPAFDVGVVFATGSHEFCLGGMTQVAVSVCMTFLMASVNSGMVRVSRVFVLVRVDACGVMVLVGLNTLEGLVTVFALKVWIKVRSVLPNPGESWTLAHVMIPRDWCQDPKMGSRDRSNPINTYRRRNIGADGS